MKFVAFTLLGFAATKGPIPEWIAENNGGNSTFVGNPYKNNTKAPRNRGVLIMNQCDTDRNNAVNQSELEACVSIYGDMTDVYLTKVRQLFGAWDLDNNGELNLDELKGINDRDVYTAIASRPKYLNPEGHW